MQIVDDRYGNAEEQFLVEASLSGDKPAFGEIVNRYQKMVARTVKGMLGDTVFAEDIGQEVFIKLYFSLPVSGVSQNCRHIFRELQSILP